MTATNDRPPTQRQLVYLRSLANRTGQTFAYPDTSRQASAEIRRLLTAAPSGRVELAIERDDWTAEAAAREANCDVPVRPEELEGYGSNSTWKERRS